MNQASYTNKEFMLLSNNTRKSILTGGLHLGATRQPTRVVLPDAVKEIRV